MASTREAALAFLRERSIEPEQVSPTGSRVRARAASDRQAVRLRRLQRRQPGVRRGFLRAGQALQRRARRLLRTARARARRLIENVSDGTDAYLVALDLGGRLLPAKRTSSMRTRRNRIKPTFTCGSAADTAGRRREVAGMTAADSRPPSPARAADSGQSAAAAAARRGRPDRLLAGHTAFVAVSVVPDAGAERHDRRQSEGGQAADHQHPAGCGDCRRHRGRDHREGGALPAGEGTPVAAGAMSDHALRAQRSARLGPGPYVPLGRLDSIEDPGW